LFRGGIFGFGVFFCFLRIARSKKEIGGKCATEKTNSIGRPSFGDQITRPEPRGVLKMACRWEQVESLRHQKKVHEKLAPRKGEQGKGKS